MGGINFLKSESNVINLSQYLYQKISLLTSFTMLFISIDLSIDLKNFHLFLKDSIIFKASKVLDSVFLDSLRLCRELKVYNLRNSQVIHSINPYFFLYS